MVENKNIPGFPEQVGEIPRWTDREIQILTRDGIAVLNLRGDTLQDQIKARRSLIVHRDSVVVPVESGIHQVGIYPYFGRFFVPGTYNATLEESENLILKDTEELKQRLGIGNITGVIPDNVANVTELIFQYAENTRVWLLGGNWTLGHTYDEEFSSFSAVRTKNPVTGGNGSTDFAVVHLEAGTDLPPRLSIFAFNDRDLNHDGDLCVATMRMFVPKGVDNARLA